MNKEYVSLTFTLRLKHFCMFIAEIILNSCIFSQVLIDTTDERQRPVAYKGGQLNIKYSKKKKELQEDPVMDGLLKTKEFVQKNYNSVIGVFVVVVLVTGISIGYNMYSTNKIKTAREDFGKAMVAYRNEMFTDAIDKFRLVAENYRGTVSSITSAYMLGGILYQQGKYDEAIQWYETAGKSSKGGFISSQASEGLALCYEMKGDVSKAVAILEKALNNEKLSYRKNALRWKLALLLRASDNNRAKVLCNEILADTLGQEYRANAEFLKTTLSEKNIKG